MRSELSSLRRPRVDIILIEPHVADSRAPYTDRAFLSLFCQLLELAFLCERVVD
jgi:hypothetical protein